MVLVPRLPKERINALLTRAVPEATLGTIDNPAEDVEGKATCVPKGTVLLESGQVIVCTPFVTARDMVTDFAGRYDTPSPPCFAVIVELPKDLIKSVLPATAATPDDELV